MRRNSGRLSVVPLIAWSAYTATTGQPSEAACARHTRTWSSMDSSRWLWDENRAYIAAACAIMSLPSPREWYCLWPRAGLPPICAGPVAFRRQSQTSHRIYIHANRPWGRLMVLIHRVCEGVLWKRPNGRFLRLTAWTNEQGLVLLRLPHDLPTAPLFLDVVRGNQQAVALLPSRLQNN